MRIVVTGACGFIGSHVCERLAADHEVIGIDCLLPNLYSAAVKAARTPALVRAGATIEQLDLRTDDLDRVLRGADAVIHEAAMPGLMPSWDQFETYLSCNVLATERLAQAALRTGVAKFVHISTSSVYGRNATGDEMSATEPFSPYGVSKLAAEKLLLAIHHNHGLPVVILRYFSIYGPRQRPDMAYHLFTEAILDGKPITVFGDGQQTRTNTYVDDCVTGTVLGLEHGRVGEAYNIGGGHKLSLLEAIEIIASNCGQAPKIEWMPARPGDQRDTAAVIGKARDELGYQPLVAPAEGLAAQVAWHRSLRSD